MAKKKRKSKKIRGRRESTPQGKQKTDEPTTVVADVRPDLRKTALLTTVCLGILLILYLTQSRWSNLSLRF